jgi:hypothetical protein
MKWSSALVPLLPFPRLADAVVTGRDDGNLPDLPPDAVRSYLQYRVPLQTAADFYIFELQDLLKVLLKVNAFRGVMRDENRCSLELCLKAVYYALPNTPTSPRYLVYCGLFSLATDACINIYPVAFGLRRSE